MAYVFHANGIVTGTINSFCLACESFLSSDQDAKHHISQTQHKQKLKEVPYAERFKDEGIRKFSTGYFCEFCNELLPIAAKVTLHIGEDEHKHNKNTLRLKLVSGDVIAFGDVMVREKAWHGLTDGICSVCNTEFDDENDHKKDTKHGLNLVLKPIKFAMDNAIYREIDASALQCLTCNTLLAPRDMTHHAGIYEHSIMYEKSRIKTNGVDKGIEEKVDKTENEILQPTKDDTKKDKTPAEDKAKIIDSINIYDRKGITINLENEVAYCRKCSITVPFTVTDIDGHVAKHSKVDNNDSEQKYPSHIDHSFNRMNINDKTSESKNDEDDTKRSSKDEDKKATNGTIHSRAPSSANTDNEENIEEDSCDDFAKENSITYNKGKGVAYCRICEVQLPSTLRSMKQHVSGAIHKKRAQPTAKLEKNLPTLSRTSTRDFVENACSVKGPFYCDIVINHEYCIPQLHHLLVSRMQNLRWRCHLCDMTFSPSFDINQHVRSDKHREKLLAAPVITSKSDEFIREVRKGLFHCGYCNLLVSSWDEMELHLSSFDHKMKRQNGEERLQSHLPDIREHEFKEQFDLFRFFYMLSR
ncbi:unnamed protein product [Chrysodeixis includens]|uniref:C2H2-type domain-containing protein n=1 Tax=Chrysodeixis includens TaxID=689277 RepID=A0A9P0BPX1_CHRIL|nr:unnamed protein product [Chrysodeixis includens]